MAINATTLGNLIEAKRAAMQRTTVTVANPNNPNETHDVSNVPAEGADSHAIAEAIVEHFKSQFRTTTDGAGSAHDHGCA